MDAAKIRADLDDIKGDLKGLAKAVASISVQDEKISNLVLAITSIRTEQCALYDRVTSLKEEHDTCIVNRVQTDVAWLKWFTLLNSAAIVMALMKYLFGGEVDK